MKINEVEQKELSIIHKHSQLSVQEDQFSFKIWLFDIQ